MKQKLPKVLDRVSKPQTRRSLSDLGQVEKIRHDEANQKRKQPVNSKRCTHGKRSKTTQNVPEGLFKGFG